MNSEPLIELEPFFLGDGRAGPVVLRREAVAQHEELMARLPSIVDGVRVVLARNSVLPGTGVRDDIVAAGEWLAANARLDLPGKPSRTSGFQVDGPDLSVPTKSACCRFGCFFGESVRKVVPDAEWTLDTSNKRHVYYHLSVITVPYSSEMLEPMSIVMNFVSRRLRGDSSKSLGDFFDIWVRELSPK